MRAFVERVSEACVKVNDEIIGRIGPGLLVYLGVEKGDSDADVAYIVEKIRYLRIFEDDEGKMNRSILDTGGKAIVVSQFTLYADTRKGNRPSFIASAPPEQASPLVDRFVELLQQQGVPTQSGRFGAHMLVGIENDGPVTIWLEM